MVENDLSHGNFVLSNPEQVHHIRSVLQLKPGALIQLFTSLGQIAAAEIISLDKSNINCLVKTVIQDANRVSLSQVNLYCAILKSEKFDWVVQKATEVGVTQIVPVLTERTIKTALKLDRLRRISLEATEQSGQTMPVTVAEPIVLVESLQTATGLKLLCDERGEPMTKVNNHENHQESSVWIGPEGGFTSPEIASAQQAGCQILRLSRTTLRAETAAIIASFLLAQSS